MSSVEERDAVAAGQDLAWRRVTETEPPLGQTVVVGWTMAVIDDVARVGFVEVGSRSHNGWVVSGRQTPQAPHWWLPVPPDPKA